MKKSMTFLSICGLLGYGFPEESVARDDPRVRFLGADAGSTDPGPHYLGSGTGFVSPQQLDRDLEYALSAARRANVPLIIGSAGGAGAAPHLEDVLSRIRRIARARRLRFRLASITADVPQDTVIEAWREGRIRPCDGAGELTERAILSCHRIVAQMGTDPIVSALEAGADVVIAGRCCDAAIFAAYPVLAGFDPAVAFHAAKIAECGTLCARPASASDSLVCTLEESAFVVEPANPIRRCTPESVAMHALYEQPSPLRFVEPEGTLVLSECTYERTGDRAVLVRGSKWIPASELTVKLEGAALRGYRAIAIAGIRDPVVIAHLDEIESTVRQAVRRQIGWKPDEEGLSLRFLRYGIDAVTGLHEPSVDPPREVGLLMEAVAPDQATADRAIALARSSALHQHFEGRKTTAGNLAFPFSPSDLSAGPVYEFAVYHLMEGADSEALFPVRLEEVDG